VRHSLSTYLYTNDFASPRWEADLTPKISRGPNFYCALHGGLQTIEFDIGQNWIDSYRFAYENIGKRIVVVDNTLDVIGEGLICDPSITAEGSGVIALGPWWLCFHQAYNDTSTWVSSGTTSAQIKDMLTDDCPNVSTNQGNVDETSTDNYPWQPADNAYPGDLIPRLASMSDSSNNEWYFWLESMPLDGTNPQKPIAYFKAQDLTTLDFWASMRDLAPHGWSIRPSLRDLANDVRVLYTDSANTQHQTASATDGQSQTDYWLREVWNLPIGQSTATVAAQYRDLYKGQFKTYQQVAEFTFNAWIYDPVGARQPLWKVVKGFPCNIRINDLVPQESQFSSTNILDERRTFHTLALRYSYDTNELSITPDTEEHTYAAVIRRLQGLSR